ncbi:MAG: AtpZ/AtpI family protein [Actinomycetota bacterium]|nr:hypothetical protein [Acidimicrobiaceae bacterium]MCH2621206.1 AtpZ/AtpI family protein [Acidimicrobiales bacterium]MEC7898602.1 AtpZ/AtpI family protein [Actinomycetota bacterium]|tara:strand:+ start:588 stop:848 length:261 start_codon:yes stop_codon:yes gene_type:complete
MKSEKLEMKQGSGDAMAAAFELVATPTIFGFLGWLLDRKFEIFPVFTLALVAITITYASWRLYRQYTLRLTQEAEERRKTWLQNVN